MATVSSFAVIDLGGGTVTLEPYEPVQQRLLRLCVEGGDVQWSYSDDGTGWTLAASVPAPAWVADAQVRVVANAWMNAAATDQFEIASFEHCAYRRRAGYARGVRKLLREPLVHFVVLGLALFALDAAIGGDDGSSATAGGGQPSGLPVPTGPIVVDDDVRATLVSHWSQTHDGPPSPAELDELVAGWIDREVLYREGLIRGLALGDAQIHERVASQMAYVLGEQVVVPEPSDAQLRDWLDAHPDRFSKAERVDFTQVFVAGTDAAALARARELLALLQAGADPDGLGDTYRGGRRFRGRTIDALTMRFGESFAAGLDTQPLATWSLRLSDEGVHLVRVDRRDAAQPATFDEVRDALRHDWRHHYRAEQLAQATARLRDKWDVVRS